MDLHPPALQVLLFFFFLSCAYACCYRIHSFCMHYIQPSSDPGRTVGMKFAVGLRLMTDCTYSGHFTSIYLLNIKSSLFVLLDFVYSSRPCHCNVPLDRHKIIGCTASILAYDAVLLAAARELDTVEIGASSFAQSPGGAYKYSLVPCKVLVQKRQPADAPAKTLITPYVVSNESEHAHPAHLSSMVILHSSAPVWFTNIHKSKNKLGTIGCLGQGG